ncbi:dipicolinic acid synthetase subunit A [Niallia taxi]|uniref:Dipicolinic acid synthetase subunit A n=2 Tax=Niallia TaxID=2837506 RepID=A0A437KFI8_9BACI|nr:MULTISPECIES: dipicolinic acid synthetase subunit A [Niallia]MCM3214695.1 dipicolinic acid synthetase subunit A [Niallia taxi]MDK8642810.1 dipicolinic acid synthetase subunit A [Niallia taxi]MED4037866.1 dipicolinic acid synthetase subunit A [Niallia taxi]RVT67051.1 dipicolinic acid synthetase subunit A [Niallia taxi]TRZ38674.1 dipicolinic acid synthetase subunit A [Niallia circulans]
MLTGMKIAIIGGDARQLEIVRKLTEQHAQLSLVGFEQLDHAFAGATKEKIDNVDFSMIDAIILPVKGTDLNGQVDTIFSNEKVFLTEEMLEKTPSHCTIYSGITNDYLNGIIKRTNTVLVQLFNRDDVAILNSIPTVEGTIMMAIQHTDTTIHGSNILVLGLGRVGMSVARTFHALGGKVKVAASESEHLARILEMGLTPIPLNELESAVCDIDICINTIPHLVVTSPVIEKMPLHTLIIDLASKPGGTDFQYAEKRGVKALLAPSLPGIVAPKTAGNILAEVLSQLLQEEWQSRKEQS